MKKFVSIVVLLTSMFAVQLVNGQTVTITPPASDICDGSGTVVTLQANPAGGVVISYLWSTGASSSTINVSPAISTTYTVTATFVGGATPTATATVTVLPQPAQGTVTPAGPTTVCTGNTVQLDASAGDAWQWYLDGSPIPGATTQTYIANATGDYTVLVTVGTCNAPMSAATTVTIVLPPTANVTPTGPLTACFGNVITLTADPVPGASYQWQYSPDGNPPWSDIVGETGQSYDADVSGFNRVEVSLGACISYSN